ncbi:hypothetical protein ABPG77_001804 [Micractinium sp. CCAP 211/92]
MFFEGSVAQAIQTSRRELRPLVVLLTGFDQGSRQVQDALIEQEGEDWATSSIVLALEDDLANTDRSQFTDAKNFRAFCPVEQLPTVVVVSPTGATLAKVAGVVSAADLRSQLSQACAAYRQQQQQMLAAQAALLAASAAGAAPPAAAPAPAPAAPAAPATEAVGTAPAAPMPAVEGRTAAQQADAHSADRQETPGIGSTSSQVDEAAPPGPATATAAGDAATAGKAGVTGGSSPQAHQPQQQQLQAEQEAPEPDPASQPYRLQFRFTDASTLRADFTGASLLSEVFQAVDEARLVAGRPPLAYVLVQAQPRLVLGAAEEGLALAASGVLPRTSLQVIPHAAAGHRPAAAAAPADQGTAVGGADADAGAGVQEAAAALGAEGAQEAPTAMQVDEAELAQQSAAPPAPPAAPAAAPVELLVRLTNGGSLQRSFGPGTKLTAVLDWVDAERTDRGAYKLVQAHPRRAFFSGDLGSTLQELGLFGRVSLLLEPLPPKPRPASKPAAPPPENKLPHMFDLQFKLTNGEQLRGSFPPEAALQEVCHFLDTHRTDGGAPYSLVQPYPKRRFGAADMQQPLLALGLQPRQLLLLEAEVPAGVGASSSWSLGGLLSSAAGYLNPLSYLRGPAGTPSEQQAQQADPQQQQQQAVVAAAAAAAAERRLAAGGSSGGGGSSEEPRGARKRPLGAGGSSNIHTLASSKDSTDDGDANKYWNGNSTEFGGSPPPGQQ